jgi:hypothetical protein
MDGGGNRQGPLSPGHCPQTGWGILCVSRPAPLIAPCCYRLGKEEAGIQWQRHVLASAFTLFVRVGA